MVTQWKQRWKDLSWINREDPEDRSTTDFPITDFPTHLFNLSPWHRETRWHHTSFYCIPMKIPMPLWSHIFFLQPDFYGCLSSTDQRISSIWQQASMWDSAWILALTDNRRELSLIKTARIPPVSISCALYLHNLMQNPILRPTTFNFPPRLHAEHVWGTWTWTFWGEVLICIMVYNRASAYSLYSKIHHAPFFKKNNNQGKGPLIIFIFFS